MTCLTLFFFFFFFFFNTQHLLTNVTILTILTVLLDIVEALLLWGVPTELVGFFQEIPEWGCGLRQVGSVALQVVYHPEESFDVLFVLRRRHFLDALQFGGIWFETILRNGVAHEGYLRATELQLLFI